MRRAGRRAPDPRVGELQTAMTELLERLDVMNSRLARLEEQGAVAEPQPRQAAPEPVLARADAAPAGAGARGRSRRACPRSRAAARASSARSSPRTTARPSCSSAADGTPTRGARSRRSSTPIRPATWPTTPSSGSARPTTPRGDYTNAVRHYNRVVNDYSDQNKAPDALFKIALAQDSTGDLALARRTLQQVIERYPYSSTASLRESGAGADQVLTQWTCIESCQRSAAE